VGVRRGRECAGFGGVALWRGDRLRLRLARTQEEPSMATPNDRVYSASHEWHKTEGESLTLGLTQFAVDQLTDVTYVEMKKPGTKFKAGEIVGEVESVKTTSDIYCMVDGEILEVNAAVVKDPSLLNTDPYGNGWLVKVKVTGKGKLGECLDAVEYEKSH
jgi:glycine cleavage system H protein